jgi:hypothetical protein
MVFRLEIDNVTRCGTHERGYVLRLAKKVDSFALTMVLSVDGGDQAVGKERTGGGASEALRASGAAGAFRPCAPSINPLSSPFVLRVELVLYCARIVGYSYVPFLMVQQELKARIRICELHRFSFWGRS